MNEVPEPDVQLESELRRMFAPKRPEPAAFERLCRLRLERDGYLAKLTPRSGDGGIDVVAIDGDRLQWLRAAFET